LVSVILNEPTAGRKATKSTKAARRELRDETGPFVKLAAGSWQLAAGSC